MKKVGDSIEVFNSDGISREIGTIINIKYDHVLVTIGKETLGFDTIDGSVDRDDDKRHIDIYEISIPENDFKNVKYRMEEEGFDYCFTGYSHWTEIEDEKFHNLKNAYLEAQSNLSKYVYERSVYGTD